MTAPGHSRPIDGLRFARSSTDRVLGGVAGGFAARHHLDSTVVRLALVVLAFAGGLGVALYLVAWVTSLDPSPGGSHALVTEARSATAMGSGSRPTTAGGPVGPGLVAQRTVSVCLVATALLLAARTTGLWPGDAVMVPVIGLGAGAGALWYGGSANGRRIDPLERLSSGRVSPVRVVAGVLLALGGVAVLVNNGGLAAAPRAAAAIGLTVLGLVVVGGPVLWQLFERIRTEQRDRIRSEERSEMAAHLHDSVLQTLALMQRATGDPRRMVMLARRQERELRAWLYGQQASSGHATVNGAFGAMTAQVELDHDIAVELVAVGDGPMDDAADALLGATREAAVNAARHAKVEAVSVYLEVTADGLVAFVRDTGCGFDPALVEDEHRGISDSIRTRLGRTGGSATVDSVLGQGTEWELRVPRSPMGRPR